MSELPPLPQAEAPPAQAPAKSGKGKLVGIILGSLLAIAVIAACIWFFILKKDPVVAEEPPAIELADYIKGKRFTYQLPPDALPAELKGTPMAQIMSQPVFIQFETNNVSQFGTTIKGRMVAMDKGTYATEGLNLVITKNGGNDTAVFTKAEPGVGDEVSLTDASGKAMKLIIMKVEPAEPLESFNMAMMGSLGLGGGGLGGGLPTGGLANLFPPSGSAGGAVKGKGKGKGKGGGYSQSSSSTGQRAEWTFGGGGKDLTRWKGQSAQNVLGVFGNPDQGKPWGQGGGAWTYKKMKITDAQGSPHKSVTFFIQNGQVVDIKLPTAVAQPPGGIE